MNVVKTLQTVEQNLRLLPTLIDSQTAQIPTPRTVRKNATAGELLVAVATHQGVDHRTEIRKIERQVKQAIAAEKKRLRELKYRGERLLDLADFAEGKTTQPPRDIDPALISAARIIRAKHRHDDQSHFIAGLRDKAKRGLKEVKRFEVVVFSAIKGAATLSRINNSAKLCERFGDYDTAAFYKRYKENIHRKVRAKRIEARRLQDEGVL